MYSATSWLRGQDGLLKFCILSSFCNIFFRIYYFITKTYAYCDYFCKPTITPNVDLELSSSIHLTISVSGIKVNSFRDLFHLVLISTGDTAHVLPMAPKNWWSRTLLPLQTKRDHITNMEINKLSISHLIWVNMTHKFHWLHSEIVL